MKLQGKLILNALISLLLCLVLVAYIIMQLLNMNAKNQNLVPAMLKVSELNANQIQTQQALDVYSFSMTAGNQDAVLRLLDEGQTMIQELTDGLLETDSQLQLIQSIETKLQALNQGATEAMSAMNSAEAKRYSTRVRGIQNDIYSLDEMTRDRYDQYTVNLEHDIQQTWQTALVGAIVLLVAVMLFNMYTSRQIAKRIRTLKDAAGQIADGDLTGQLPEARGKDELDDLSRSFGIMTHNIRGIIQSIGAAGHRVDLMAQDIDRGNDTAQAIVQQVSRTTEELSIGSQKIAEDLSETVMVVDKMQSTFNSNLESTSQSVIDGREVLTTVEEGNKAVAEQLRLAEVNRMAMAEVEQTVRELEESAVRITTMTAYVSEIAKQTTMLSLNASIEAARAGEAGRGFAVVAGEVNKLAEQSAQSVKHIYAAVGEITTSMDKVKNSVAQSMQLFGEQEQATSQTRESFSAIRESVERISTGIHQLAEDMQHSNELSTHVQQAIENISAITEQSAASSEEITASTSEQQRSFADASIKVKSLRDISAEMHQELLRFRL
ncbi:MULTISPECIES: methyl-accepting chemotaxis protein [unclassified Paenibacillus]|uniref:methyl-accepting chemotaxis protein n=1 Tax=unclassified Paenibacillus TaxID=185978 RepID=UPI000CFC392E|nr:MULTISPECIES: methyl-accepting chemotaxis protein [unclassified Paenibacillus]PRA01667.1 methyl-accepting chemotaxis protein [Paenibacillus sp. MYb63]PRA40302.1 methyl-accepting chemotaxis protein [Paenibacillus sp. MYb67]QZN77586.1 methyl-accepting chemotaxis protein [Paenibacillus sp. DR312]